MAQKHGGKKGVNDENVLYTQDECWRCEKNLLRYMGTGKRKSKEGQDFQT